MGIYVGDLSRELGRQGITVDGFTRSQNPNIPRTGTGPAPTAASLTSQEEICDEQTSRFRHGRHPERADM